MQSEKFDKRVREAAEHHHPSYDEQAWDRMEKLLDKHLPQKEEKKRRFIFIIFLFLLLGGSAWLLTARPWEKEVPVAGIEKPGDNLKPRTTIPNNTDPHTGQDQLLPGKITAPDHPVQELLPGPQNFAPSTSDDLRGTTTNKTTLTRQQDQEPSVNRRNPDLDKSVMGQDKSNMEVVSNTAQTRKKTLSNKDAVVKVDVDGKSPQQDKNLATGKKDKPFSVSEKPASNPGKEVTEMAVDKDDQQTDKRPALPVVKTNTLPTDSAQTGVVAKQQTEKKPESQKAEEGPRSEAKANPKKKNSLSLALSTGPDISFVGDNKPGRTQIVMGLGLEYTIREKFSIRTGFYSARKIYTAKPDDYKAPPEFYQAYPYLEKVEANCRVYEIPFSVSYQFGKKSSGKWFVSAGISSFLMNEETYDYFYKYTPTGNTFSNEWTIRNENYHMFSVGTLSAGYKRNIGSRFSLTTEPYVKIPFSGVGYGKVKLNSGGVLFTVGVKLF